MVEISVCSSISLFAVYNVLVTKAQFGKNWQLPVLWHH